MASPDTIELECSRPYTPGGIHRDPLPDRRVTRLPRLFAPSLPGTSGSWLNHPGGDPRVVSVWIYQTEILGPPWSLGEWFDRSTVTFSVGTGFRIGTVNIVNLENYLQSCTARPDEVLRTEMMRGRQVRAILKTNDQRPCSQGHIAIDGPLSGGARPRVAI